MEQQGWPRRARRQVTEDDMSERGRPGEAGQERRAGTRQGRYGRRAVVLGAAAAGAGAVAGLTGGTGVAQAAGSPVELGQLNTSTASTVVSTSGGSGLYGETTANARAGIKGVDNSPDGGYGVYGSSQLGMGVYGTSADSAGVYGQTSSSGQAGVQGADNSGEQGYGVYGTSQAGYGVYATSQNVGVYGSGAPGVWGQIGSGGIASLPAPEFAAGLMGVDVTSAGNTGIWGASINGLGVFAGSKTGTALQVDGPVQFSSSGVSTVDKGSTSVTVKTSAVTKSTIVLATLQKLESGVYIEAAVPGTGSFTITLNKAAGSDLPVGWFFLG
jgi:hypothetical protein